MPAGPLVCLLAGSNQPDTVFTRNVRGLQGWVEALTLLPGGQLLLLSNDTLRLGAVTRPYLLRLNANGTPDASFDASLTSASWTRRALSQPDGRLVLQGYFSFADGSNAGPLVRLLGDGRRDLAFQTAVASLGLTRPNSLALQPDGKLLLAGRFNAQGVLRLLPTGALDPTFSAPTLPSSENVANLALQPDGSLLVLRSNPSVGGAFPLERLTATGAADGSFQSPSFYANFDTYTTALQVQPDGRVLVQTTRPVVAGQYSQVLLRLEDDGSLDTSFDVRTSIGDSYVTGMQLLPNGQLLLARPNTGPLQSAGGLVLLNADGSRDTSFVPALFVPGQVNEVIQRPDGSYLMAGDFTEVNGVARAYLAHLSATGVPDPTFPAAAPDDIVYSLLLQPDGKLLLCGSFEHLGTTTQAAIGRLLPAGTIDTGFAPPFVPAPTYRSFDERRRLGRLPDGRILLTGPTRLATATANEYVLRLLDGSTGQPDLSIPGYQASDVLVQPNGQAVVAGFYSPNNNGIGSVVFRLLANGQPDPSFTNMPGWQSGYGSGPVVENLAQDSTGRLFYAGYYTLDTSQPSPYAHFYQLTRDGVQTAVVHNDRFRQVGHLAVQATGQVLVATDLASAQPTFGLSRLLPTLALDAGFVVANGPYGPGNVRRLLAQPDGAIMVAGGFTQVGGQAIGGLVHLLAPGVLGVAEGVAQPRTQAWPVPAHDRLHLALEAAARPRCVELLDALGRVVLARPVAAPELTLDTAYLPAGAYVLRVQYAQGPATRRVVLE